MTLNSKITRGSSGFTLIELLVVVAILGILAAIGIASYNGYVDSSKKKSAENIMMQIGLAQTEYYSDTSTYYTTGSGTNCTPTSTTSTAIEGALLNGADLITDEIGFEICIHEASAPSNFTIVGKQTSSNCTPTSATSTAIETNLLSGADLITDEIGFEVCIHPATAPTNYKIVGKQTTSSCIIRVDGNQTSSRENC